MGVAIDHSPLDVVAWHGNYAPYKYDLRRYSRSARFSSTTPTRRIFTVLTSRPRRRAPQMSIS